MVDDPERDLRLLDDLVARGELDDYQHLHCARGGLLRRFFKRRLAAGAHAAPDQP
jgi:predicted RNA polymerase sigma factor